MADDFTLFSCVLDVRSADNMQRARAIYREMEIAYANFEATEIGFMVEADGPVSLWIHDGDSFGNPEHVAAFVLRCAAECDLKGRWGFTWALTCPRPCTDGFGGGAQLLDLSARTRVDRIDCELWLAACLCSPAAT